MFDAVLSNQASNIQEITNWENILITKNKDNMNFEILPAGNLTRKYILNSVEGKRSAPTRNLNSQQSVMS